MVLADHLQPHPVGFDGIDKHDKAGQPVDDVREVTLAEPVR